MRLKRQLFRPGRRIEQIGKLATYPFFTRREAGKVPSPPAVARRPPGRGLLPRIAENSGALFSIVVSLLLVAALLALTYAFVRDIRRDAFELDVFTAPKEITERGYTSTAIGEAVLDEIRAIQNHAFTLEARRQLEVAAVLPDVQVAGSGLSMKAIVRYARRLVDLPDNRITGDLLQDGKKLKLALRIRQAARTQLIVVARDDGDVDRLLRDAGRAIVQIADPYLLVVYLFGHEAKARSFPETRAAIDYVLANGRPNERANAYAMLGAVQRLEGQPEDALASFRRNAALDAAGGLPLVVDQLVRMGRDAEALDLARTQAASATSADDWMAAAFMMSYLGRDAEAFDYAKRALARDPKGAEPYNNVAGALFALHRAGEGVEVAKRGWQLNPDDRDLPSTVAYGLLDSGRPAEALEICNTELAAWPGDLWCHEMRGYAYATFGRVEEALREYRYAIDNGNNSPILLTKLGDLLLANGQTREALAQYQAALMVRPRLWIAHTGWARAQLALGNAQAAADRFAATAKDDPDDPLLYREWASALDLLGKKDDATAKRAEADKAEARLKVPLPL
jgi:tetratricopeptide (TPR) repeat protein